MKMRRLGFVGAVLIVLFMLAGCGKSGDKDRGGGAPAIDPPPSSEPILPPTQTSTTDESGRVTFLSSKGELVIYKINDISTQQPLSNILVTYSERQNQEVLTNVVDSTGVYIPVIRIDSFQPSSNNQNKSSKENLSEITDTAIGLLPFVDLGETLIRHRQGVDVLIKLGGNFNNVGLLQNKSCMTVRDYIALKEKLFESEDAGGVAVDTGIDAGDLLAKLKDLGIKLSILLNVTKEIFTPSVEHIEGVTLEYLYAAKIIDDISPDALDKEITVEYSINISPSPLLSSLVAAVPRVVLKPLPASCQNVVPSAPKNLRAVAISDTQINLTWDAVPNETTHNIEYSLDGTNFKSIYTVEKSNIFNHTFLSPNTTYYYRVNILSSAGKSEYSNIVDTKTLAEKNKNPIISSININSSPVLREHTSTISCIATDPDGDPLTYIWTKLGGSFSGSGSTITWNAPSTAGTYTVTCNVSDGKGGIAAKGVIITVSDPIPPISPPVIAVPNAPANLSATAGSSSRVNLSWSDGSTNEDGFKIERKTGTTGVYAEIQTVGVNAINFVDLGLSANTFYCYRIRAFSSAGDSISNESCTTTFGNVGTIEVVVALDGLAWPGTVNYSISGPANINGTDAPTTFSGRPAGTYTLTYNSGGPSGTIFTGINPSAIQTLNTDGTVLFILNFTTQLSPVLSVVPGGLVDFGSVAAGESTSRVYSVLNTGNGTLTGNVSVAAPFSVHSGGQIQGSFSIPAGQGQSLVIRFSPTSAGTFNGTINITSNGGDATRSVTGVGVTPPSTTPASPGSLSATALSSSLIALVWQDNADSESGFKIERKTGTTGSFSQLAVVGALSGTGQGGYFENSGLSASTNYCYRVRAYNGNGDSSYSNETCATTQTPPPVLPSATTGSATNITSISATLNGTINPNGVSTGAFFQWGNSSSYGNLTPSQVLGNGTTNVNVSANLTGLSPSTTYHFRIVASNGSGGTTFGTDQIFTTGSASGSTERITNGSFSSGTAGWILSGDFWAGTNLSNHRTSPGYAAGGVDNAGQPKNSAIGTMYQTVTIPATATTATLSFWYNITSQETGSTPFDVLNVTIQNSSGSFLATVAVRSNLHKGAVGVYDQVSFDVTAYKGQTIRVHFLAATDGASNTVFRIDDVSLIADGN